MGIGKLASKAFTFIERKAVTTQIQTGWLKAGEKLEVKGLKFAPELNVNKYIKHRNLTSFLKKELKTPKQVEQILKECPQTSRHIGALPSDWLTNIPKSERADYTKKISGLFSYFAQKTSLPRKIEGEAFNETVSEFGKRLQALTGQNVEVSYLGKGTIGRTFKIKVGKNTYVSKSFFPDPQKHGYYSSHGKGAEICNASFASKHAVKGQFADFYFGKFARHDDNDGFLVTKFIDINNARISRIKNKSLNLFLESKVFSNDSFNIENSILDTVLDYGAVSKGYLKNDKRFKIQRLLKEAIDTDNSDKYNIILKKFKGHDLDFVLKETKENLSEALESLEVIKTITGLSSLKSKEAKLVTSDKHNKLYRLINTSIRKGNRKEYESIVTQYKNSKELKEVLEIYNFDMKDDILQAIDTKVHLTENERIISVLKKIGLFTE